MSETPHGSARRTSAYHRIAEQIRATWLDVAQGGASVRLPTQEELARHFGVSRSTIIRALSLLADGGSIYAHRGSGTYTQSTRVGRTASRTLALIVPHLTAEVVVAATRGFERRAAELGCKVILASSDSSLAKERVLSERQLADGVAGLAVYPVTRLVEQADEDHLNAWTSECPLVALDIARTRWPVDIVGFDNYALGREVTRGLLERGRRRIAFMQMHGHFHSSILDRAQGWDAEMAASGVTVPSAYRGWPRPAVGWGEERFRSMAAELLALEPRPDAVIAWTDEPAALLIRGLQSLGVRIPDDITVTGFDNTARHFRPEFTTTLPRFERIGELAADLLVRALDGQRERPRTYLLPVEVQWREPAGQSHHEGRWSTD